MSRIAILGAGAYGTALAIVAARAGRSVCLWGRDAAQMDTTRSTRRNGRYLPDAQLPASIEPTAKLDAIADCAVVVLAVPCQQLGAVARASAPYLSSDVPVVAAAKGLEQQTGRFATEIVQDALPDARAAILSGPSFAIDMARGLPTAVTLAAGTDALARSLAESLSGPGFRIYHTDDIRGVEIGGAAKNVLAIAAGIVAGAGLGESARAAIIARGFAELRRLALAKGAQAETLMGLSGLGDLVLTASSPQSRNFALGHALGAGGDRVGLLGTGKLAEGVPTAPALAKMAKAAEIDMPIVTAVAAVLAGNIDVAQAIDGLMSRPLRRE